MWAFYDCKHYCYWRLVRVVTSYCKYSIYISSYLNILHIWGSKAVNDLWIPKQQRIYSILPISHCLYSSICWFIKLRGSLFSEHSILCFPYSFFNLSTYNLVLCWAAFVPSMSRMFVTPLPIGVSYWSTVCSPLSFFIHLIDPPIQNENYLLQSDGCWAYTLAVKVWLSVLTFLASLSGTYLRRLKISLGRTTLHNSNFRWWVKLDTFKTAHSPRRLHCSKYVGDSTGMRPIKWLWRLSWPGGSPHSISQP